MSQLDNFTVGETPPKDKYAKDLETTLDKIFGKIKQILNGGILFSDNFDAQLKTVTTAGADTEVSVAHTLKRTPTGYLVYSRDKAAVIYDSTTAWTANNIYIKANVATVTAKLIIF